MMGAEGEMSVFMLPSVPAESDPASFSPSAKVRSEIKTLQL